MAFSFGRSARLACAAALALMPLGVVALAPNAGANAAPEGQRRVAHRFSTRTVHGEKIALGELLERGPVLLDFWATWCKPCLAAIPELEKLSRDLGPRGLTVVGISVDGPRNFAKVRPFAKRLGITYPIVLDEDGNLQQRYQANAMPTTVLVDRSGTIVKVVQGYRPGEIDGLRAAIEALLPEAPADTTAPSSP